LNVRNPILEAKFRRDVKLAQRRGKEMSKLRELILLLIDGDPLPARYKDHPLSGDWEHHRDCHIVPDWLLLYKIDGGPLSTPSPPARSSIIAENRAKPKSRDNCAFTPMPALEPPCRARVPRSVCA
jgi:mRNA interferase YafQ